jgi:hypothetical protein
MAGAEGPAGRLSELEPVVSLVDVLEEDEELENEACAVLGGSDAEKCSYSQVGARPGPRFSRGSLRPASSPPVFSIPACRGHPAHGAVPCPGPAALLSSAFWVPAEPSLLAVFLRQAAQGSVGFGPGWSHFFSLFLVARLPCTKSCSQIQTSLAVLFSS